MAELKLTDRKIKSKGVGLYGDGGGLYLKKQRKDSGQWVYRFSLSGERPEMGLGGWPAVSLAKARSERDKWRDYLKDTKRDPRAERDRLKLAASVACGNTLAQITESAFEAIKDSLRDGGKAARWDSPIKLHVLPKLGNVSIMEINQHDIEATLKPIWKTKAPTAEKAINRLGIVFDHARAKGLKVSRQTVKDAKTLLGDQGHRSKPTPAMDWKDVPAFYKSLSDGTITQLAMRLLILTGLRSKPIRFCHIDEIQDDVWVVSAKNMKATIGSEKEFVVPLSHEAISVINEAKSYARDGFLFPNVRKGVLSDATLSRYMSRNGYAARPHGFRSSFKTWASEMTEIPREITEMSLAHNVGNEVERAYMRSDLIDRRRVLMERWAGHVIGRKISKKVISIDRRNIHD